MPERYFEIVAAVDSEFARNRSLHGERIRCGVGCTDCCHHFFQITAIEAAHIAGGVAQLHQNLRETLEQRAREYTEARSKLPAREPIGKTRMACPALQEGKCSIYNFRPLMCHKFGMPLYNPDRPGQIFACELNFRDGEEIHDDQLIQIQTGIHHSWKDLQREYQESGGSGSPEPWTVATAIVNRNQAL